MTERVIMTENGEQVVVMRNRHSRMVKLIVTRENAVTTEITLTEQYMRELVAAWVESERIHD